MAKQSSPPDAIMLLGSRCPHCPGVLKNLAELVKTGELGTLKVINLEQHPEAATEFRVRSVPWVKIGVQILNGAQDMAVLRQHIQWAQQSESQASDFNYLLSEAQADKVLDRIKSDPDSIKAVMDLLGDPATVLSTRIGIGVVMEEFAGSDLLNKQIPVLAELANHKDARIRADVLHYLGLTLNKEAINIIRQHLDDPDAEVREVARESLEELENTHGG